MRLGKILIVNDDIDDVVKMQERLRNIEVLVSGQRFAARGTEAYEARVILLDNDANDLEEARGVKTLRELREKTDAPVVYTSFQPGWVADEVKQTPGVTVVRTDQALDYLAREHGVELAEPVAAEETGEPQLNVMVTYNEVTGYKSDMYGNGKLLIVSFDERSNKRSAQQIVADNLKNVFGSFDWRKDREIVRNVFAYDGVRAEGYAAYSAAAMGHGIRLQVKMLTCPCDPERKSNFRDTMDTRMYRVECGGRESLGAIADEILGITRVVPGRLPMTKEEVHEIAPRYEI
tara:strand:+ start:354 stop:1223 length:870 start_codon:yes stop_codon:yes gene_type:complete